MMLYLYEGLEIDTPRVKEIQISSEAGWMSRCRWISYPEDVWHGWPWFRTWILLEVSCIFGSGSRTCINIHNFRFLPKEPPGGSWKSWRRIGPVSTLDSTSLVEVCGLEILLWVYTVIQIKVSDPIGCTTNHPPLQKWYVYLGTTSPPTQRHYLWCSHQCLWTKWGVAAGQSSFVDMMICVVQICPMNSTSTCVMDSSFHGMCLFNHLVIQLCVRTHIV